MRWLALDVGSRRVGLAISDASENLTFPLPAVSFDHPARLAERIVSIGADREIEGVVVGVPVTASGVGKGEQRVTAVVQELRLRLTVPIETVDEHGTTGEAQARLRGAGVPAKKWSSHIDSVAAQVILESYIALRRREIRAKAVDLSGNLC
jgi:putative Holliday junction resolvase